MISLHLLFMCLYIKLIYIHCSFLHTHKTVSQFHNTITVCFMFPDSRQTFHLEVFPSCFNKMATHFLRCSCGFSRQRLSQRIFHLHSVVSSILLLPFTLAGIHLFQVYPDILLHPFHPACILFFIYLPHSPLLCTVERLEPMYVYLKSSTFQ